MMSSGPNIYERVSDVELRPWTIDPLVDERLQEEAYDFEDCLCATSHSKSAGGLGISILDKQPREQWHLRNTMTTTIPEFEEQLRQIVANNSLGLDTSTNQFNEDFEDPNEIEEMENEYEIAPDVDILVVDREEESLADAPVKRTLTKSDKHLLLKALKQEKVLMAKEKKALKAVRYVHREGLHTIQVPLKKHNKLRKVRANLLIRPL